LIGDCEGGLDTVACKEKLFGDDREGLQSVIVGFVLHSHNSSCKYEHAYAV